MSDADPELAEASYNDEAQDAGAYDDSVQKSLAIDPAEEDFPDTVFKNLDYGLYWFGKNGAYQKAIPNQPNEFYSADRKTIVHIHGWQKDKVPAHEREIFDLRRDSYLADVGEDIAAPWVDQDYNVGFLYWTQFADEPKVEDAEAKIWSASGPQKMRWRSDDGKYRMDPDVTYPNVSVGTLLTNSLLDNIEADFVGPSFVLTGHSLGNQLAVVVAGQIHDRLKSGAIDNRKVLPGRVALLDPYYSSVRRAFLGNKTSSDASADIVATLTTSTLGEGFTGVAFEAYRSSAVAFAANSRLIRYAALANLKPSYYSAIDIGHKHMVGWWWYYASKAFAPPVVSGSGTISPALSASSSVEQVKTFAANRQFFEQDTGSAGGATTKTPSDDRFTMKKW